MENPTPHPQRNSGAVHFHQNDKYQLDLSRFQLKASCVISAILFGLTMFALPKFSFVPDIPISSRFPNVEHPELLVFLQTIIIILLVSVTLLAFAMSICLLSFIETIANGGEGPNLCNYHKLEIFIQTSWILSTCVGPILFLLALGIISGVKFYIFDYIFTLCITALLTVVLVCAFGGIFFLMHVNVGYFSTAK